MRDSSAPAVQCSRPAVTAGQRSAPGPAPEGPTAAPPQSTTGSFRHRPVITRRADRLHRRQIAMMMAGHLVPALERRSEEHTSELQSRGHLVCRLLLEKKKTDQEHTAELQAHGRLV